MELTYVNKKKMIFKRMEKLHILIRVLEVAWGAGDDEYSAEGGHYGDRPEDNDNRERTRSTLSCKVLSRTDELLYPDDEKCREVGMLAT